MMILQGQIKRVRRLSGKLSKPTCGSEIVDNTIETIVEVITDNSIDSVITNNSSVVVGSDILKGGYVIVGYSCDGGVQPYQYACDYKELSSAEWITAFDYNSQASNRIDGLNTGYYVVNAKIKDSVNQESFKTFVVEIENKIPIS